MGYFETKYRLGEFIDWYAKAQERGLKSHIIPRVLLRRRLHTTNTGIVNKDKRNDYVSIVRAALNRRRAIHAASNQDACPQDHQGSGLK